jgi:small subunit ribosomal protein S17
MNDQTTQKEYRHRKSRTGVVVSDKMDKTIVVQVDQMVMHPVYKKFVRKRLKYQAHDEHQTAKAGDKVLIEECRPISRHKHWRLKQIVEQA